MTSWQKQLLPNSLHRRLLDSLPLRTFIDLSKMVSFNNSNILLMTMETVPQVELTFQMIGELPFGNLELVLCGGIAHGYVLSSNLKCKRIVGRNYVSMIRKHSIDPDFQRVFIDRNLIIHANDSAMVAVVATKVWI